MNVHFLIMDDLSEESEKVLQNCLKVALDTCHIGAGMLQELDSQKEQLVRTEGRLNHIDASLKQSEKTLTRMERFWGLFPTSWHRSPKPNGWVESPCDVPVVQEQQVADDELGRTVQILKQQALVMNAELTSHNQIIDRISERTKTAHKRVQSVSKRTTDML